MPSSFLRVRPTRQAMAAILALSALVWAAGLEAQVVTRPQFGVGYVANAPDAVAGASAYALWPVLGGLGLYVDAKFDIDSPNKDIAFRTDIDAEDMRTSPEFSGARFLNQEFSFKSLNVAVLRPLTTGLMVYAGGGVAWGENYKLYEQIIGELGYAIWVADPGFDETRVNVMGGFMLRLNAHLTTQFGYETQPKGVTAGISLRIPSW